MDLQSLEPLPYTQSYHPTLKDYDNIIAILKQKVSTEIALKIVAYSHDPWIKNRLGKWDDRGHMQFGGASLCLSSDPIPVVEGRKTTPRRIVIQAESTHLYIRKFRPDPFHQSHSWFEVSIIRPCAPNHTTYLVLVDGLNWCEPSAARDVLKRNLGWDFVEGEGGRITWHLFDTYTGKMGEWNTYKVDWEKGLPSEEGGEEFLGLLEPGCIVILWARSKKYRWHKVGGATIEIGYDGTYGRRTYPRQ
ncbi:hypothetical protein F5B19DRAFT_423168 [Rostrohypoxylon terebratum]|nr:hypothetical protein F5B19DRAFT_423168 [Rostrohypoxylon terebratum]